VARKDKDLAGFGDVAEVTDYKKNNINPNVNNDIDIKDNDDVNENTNEDDNTNTKEDFLGQLLEDSKKKDELVLVGVYLDKDVAKVLDRLGKKGGRGMKSRIVNETLRNLFKESGHL
jgi:deoxyadenosine/deoxycytidine kinase